MMINIDIPHIGIFSNFEECKGVLITKKFASLDPVDTGLEKAQLYICVNSETNTPSGLLVYPVAVSGKKKKKILKLDFKNRVTLKSIRENWVPKQTY